jgi:adenosylcobinamide-GDP ribazoletransferase
MRNFLSSLFGGIIFYSIIRLPHFIPVNFERIARWLAWLGILIGIFLSFADWIANQIHLPVFTTSTFIVGLWIYLTGGLHLDGVMDTADGLAVPNLEKRLEVMRDSVTGSFGVMAGVMVITLKIASLTDMSELRWLALMLSPSWGRWGQLMAIAFYHYLREEGKGSFLKRNLAVPSDLIVGTLFIIPLIIIQIVALRQSWWLILIIQLGCGVIALLVGWWFNRQLGGHTGDTYGATIEWSEALILGWCTLILSN